MMMDGRIDYIIAILLCDIPGKKLPLEMQNYISTYTYLDARKYQQNLGNVRKRIRFAMPNLPLNQIKVLQYFHINLTTVSKILTLLVFWGLFRPQTPTDLPIVNT